jgi:signal transduction histidine kinase
LLEYFISLIYVGGTIINYCNLLILTTLSKRNVALLCIIAATGVSLSILSYQYSTFIAGEISKAASKDVRLNSRIEVYDLSRILVRSIDSITTNLRILANAPTIQNNKSEDAQILFSTAQASTNELTDGYYWFDQNGRAKMWSNMNHNVSQRYKDLDISSMEYFSIPKSTHLPYYSSVIESADNTPRLYISFPIISNEAKFDNEISINKSRTFNGVIVAAIGVSNVGKFLQNELSPGVLSNVGLMDKNGIILYSRNQLLIGKNYLGDEFQSLITPQIKRSYNDIIKRSLEGRSGAEDITFYGNTTTISYQPVLIDGKQLWTLFIGTPHILASDVNFLIGQQKNFSTLMVIIIGTIALGIAFLILSWNRRLEAAVNARTAELKEANNSLTKSNRLLAAANEQLKVHDKMQKEFINIAAHELRTPIMPILGEAEYIEHQFNDRKRKVIVENEQIALIIRNAKRLERLASDILDVSKIESQSLKLNKERFNLNNVLCDTIQDIRNRLANDNGLDGSVKVYYKPKDIIVEADKGRITQVVSNLLNNAVKFTGEGVISVSAERKDDQIIVSIRDTGQGIASEISPRLFSKFATKSETGTGLGLFISKSIVEAHGGKIWAENNSDGRGATFSFSIPLAMEV